MSDLTLFEGNALANSDLFKSLQSTTNNLLGGSGGGMRRISIRGRRFRAIVGSEQISVSKSDSMNIVIVNAAKISRTYYDAVYDPDKPATPHCWSADTQTPSPDVPEDQRMAARCMDCPMNVKGSGQGESRACRYSQRVAVALENSLDKIYQLQLPATSVFGDGRDGKMPMQAYARFLNAHNTPPIAVVTEMYFDEDSDGPKLFFKPLRPLSEEELKEAAVLLDDPDTARVLTMSVAKPKEDVSAPAALEKPAPAAKPKEAKKEVKAEEPTEEPTKVAKKSDSGSKDADPDLNAIVDAWDDD